MLKNKYGDKTVLFLLVLLKASVNFSGRSETPEA